MRFQRSLKFSAAVFLLLAAAASAADFSAWLYKKKITLNTSAAGVSATLTHFPVLIRLTGSNFDFSLAQSDGRDIRFAGEDRTTEYSHEIERWDAGAQKAEIWVRVNSIQGSNNNQYLWMYCGNDAVASTSTSSGVFQTSNNFQGVWHLNENGNTNIDGYADATFNQNHGTGGGANTPAAVDGAIGRAQNFQPNSQIVISGSASSQLSFADDGNYTISAWVNLDVLTGQYQCIVGKGDYQYTLQVHPNNLWQFTEFGQNYGYKKTNTGAGTANWVMLTAVKNGVNNQKLYLNGAEVDNSIELEANAVARQENWDVSFGWNIQSGQPFDGKIDEVRMSNTPRSADWIKLCYQNQRSSGQTLAEYGPTLPHHEDYEGGWSYHHNIILNTSSSGAGVGNTVNNFPVLVRLNASNFDFSQADNEGDDLRFSGSDGEALDYEIEAWDNAEQAAAVWVRVPSVAGNNKTQYIRMHWGKSGAVGLSSGPDVFQTSNGFASVWHMNDNAADKAVADARGRHHGTHNVNTDTRDAAGLVAGALSYNGSSTYTTIGDHADFREEGPVTMSVWVYNEDPDGGEFRGIYVKGRDNPVDNYWMGFWRDGAAGTPGKWHFRAASYGDWDDAAVGEWTHLALTYVNGGAWEAYINGVDVGGGTQWAGEPINGPENIYLGRAFNSGEYFLGSLDEVRWCTAVRSPDWIKLAYENQKLRNTLVQFDDLAAWQHSAVIYLNTGNTGANVVNDVFNFPVLLRLSGADFNFGEARDNGEDVRFTNSLGQPLFHEVERWNKEGLKGDVWVMADHIQGNNSSQTLTMYWGNSQARDGSNPKAIFNSSEGWVGAYHMTGTEDATGLGNTAVKKGADEPVRADAPDCLMGDCMDFDGVDDYMVIADNSSLDMGSTFSVSFWARNESGPGDFGNARFLSRKIDWSDKNGWEISRLGSDDDVLEVLESSGGTLQFQNTVNSWAAGRWEYITVVFEGRTQTVFGNGEQIYQDVNNTSVSDNDLNIVIGDDVDFSEGNFNGKLDEVRLFGGVHSADWITLCYENQKANQKFAMFHKNRLSSIGYGNASIIAGSAITHSSDGSGMVYIPFQVRDSDGDLVGLVGFSYSVNGGVSFYGGLVDASSGALNADIDSYFASGADWNSAPVHVIEFNTRHPDIADLFDGDLSTIKVVIGVNDGSSTVQAVTDNFRVDNRAPVIIIDSVTSAARRPQILFHTDEPVILAKLTVNEKTYDALPLTGDSLDWAVPEGTVSQLLEGVYDVSVRVSDYFGNSSRDTLKNALTINLDVPQVTVVSQVTASLSPGLSGTVSDTAAQCTVTVSGQSFPADVYADGTWRVPPGVFGPLAPGKYDVRVTATNLSGTGTDETVDELEIISNTLAVSMTDLRTKVTSPALGGTVSDSAAAINITIAGQALLGENNGDGTWILPAGAISALEEDSHTVVVSASRAGKQTAYDTGRVVIDLTPPQPLVTAPPPGSKTGLEPLLSIRFGEAVYAGGGNIRIYSQGNIAPEQLIPVSSQALAGWGTENLIIHLEQALTASTVYYVLIADSCIRDSVGNFFGGISSPAAWSFETRHPDDTYIDSITPLTAPGLLGQGDSLRFTVYFSEPVTLSGGFLLVTLKMDTRDTVLEISGIDSAATVGVTYAVYRGDLAARLTIANPLGLSAGASLVNEAGRSVILSVDAGKNLHDKGLFTIDGVPPRFVNVTPGSGAVILSPKVTYTLAENLVSGALAWSGGMLNDLPLDTQGSADTVLTGFLLETGTHEIRFPDFLLMPGGRYRVTLRGEDPAGNTDSLVRTAVKLAGGIGSIMIYPADTTVALGDVIAFRAVGLDNSGGSLDLISLDNVTWSSWGDGNINTMGTFLASKLGIGYVSAAYGTLHDTSLVTCGSGSIIIPPAGDDTVFLGSNVEIIIPPQEPALGESEMNVALMDKSEALTEFQSAGPAVRFSNSGGGSFIFSDPVTLRLRLDDAFSGSEFSDRVQVYWVNPARGGLWEWIDADRQGLWLVIQTDTLRSYFVGLDTVPPVLGWLTRPEEGVYGVPLQVQVSALDNISNPQVMLRIGAGGGRGDSTLALPYTRHVPTQGEIPAGWLTGAGLYYTIAITDGSNTVVLDTVDVRVRLNGALSLPDDIVLVPNMYTMVSFPLQSDQSYMDSLVYDDWGPYDSTAWRLFRYRESFREMQGRDRIYPGQAYWFRYKEGSGDKRISLDSGSVRTLPVSRPFGLSLSPGWNCISNPFLFSIGPDQVRFGNGAAVQNLYSREEGLWHEKIDVTSLDPWKGYLIWNGDDLAPFSDSAMIWPSPLPAGAAKSAGAEGTFRIRLRAENGTGTDGELIMAFGAPGSLAGRDFRDSPKPVFPDDHLDISLKPSWDTAGAWLTDYRGELGEGQAWTFTLKNVEAFAGRLVFGWPGALPENTEAVLMDRARGRVVEMPAPEALLLKGSAGPEPFELAVGSPEYIREKVDRFKKQFSIFSLSQNYPNPFSGVTHIRYSIPAGDTRTVRMHIFDLRGNQVADLTAGSKPPGAYQIDWNGTDGCGRVLPAGTYFLRLQAGDRLNAVRKMVILR